MKIINIPKELAIDDDELLPFDSTCPPKQLPEKVMALFGYLSNKVKIGSFIKINKKILLHRQRPVNNMFYKNPYKFSIWDNSPGNISLIDQDGDNVRIVAHFKVEVNK